jgi:hypothetical protein
MSTLVISLIVVGVVLLGGLLALLRNRNQPMGSPEVLERARQRNLELEARERREAEADDAR